MNYIEIMIALLLTLMAWVANEAVELFRQVPEPYFAMHIYATDDPVVAWSNPGYNYYRVGLIYGGTFELGDGPVINDDAEWWEIRISPFSPHYVWISVDYNLMTTTLVRPDKIINFGADIIY